MEKITQIRPCPVCGATKEPTYRDDIIGKNVCWRCFVASRFDFLPDDLPGLRRVDAERMISAYNAGEKSARPVAEKRSAYAALVISILAIGFAIFRLVQI